MSAKIARKFRNYLSFFQCKGHNSYHYIVRYRRDGNGLEFAEPLQRELKYLGSTVFDASISGLDGIEQLHVIFGCGPESDVQFTACQA